MVADRVGEADDIEPGGGHAFAVMRRSQQSVDELGVGLGRRVLHEGVDFFRRGRQAQQVGMEATGEGATIRFGGGRDALGLESGGDEGVDRFLRRRDGGFARGFVRPMVLVFRAFGDPALEELLLLRRQLLMRIRRRHHLIWIGEEESLHEFAGVGLARYEGFLFQRFLADIQAELGLAMARIVAVAIEAVVGKDRTDVAIEFDRVGGGRRRGDQTQGGEGDTGAHGDEVRIRGRTTGGKEGKGGIEG